MDQSDSTRPKICTKCKAVKPTTEFTKDKYRSDGLSCRCKACDMAYRKTDKVVARRKNYYETNKESTLARCKEYYLANKDVVLARNKAYGEANKDKKHALHARWVAENPERKKLQEDLWRAANKDRVKARVSEYRKVNREAIAANQSRYNRERVAADPVFAMRKRLHSLIGLYIRKSGHIKKTRVSEILGCDWYEFKIHIERQFTNGMTWENRGRWHLDHILPMATAKTEADVIALNHFTNFRPLWAAENIAKGGAVTHLI